MGRFGKFDVFYLVAFSDIHSPAKGRGIMKFLAVLSLFFCVQSAWPEEALARWNSDQINAFFRQNSCQLSASDEKGSQLYSRDLNDEIRQGKNEPLWKISTRTYVIQMIGNTPAGYGIGYVLVAWPVQDVTRGTELYFTFDSLGLFVTDKNHLIGISEFSLDIFKVLHGGDSFSFGRRAYTLRCNP